MVFYLLGFDQCIPPFSISLSCPFLLKNRSVEREAETEQKMHPFRVPSLDLPPPCWFSGLQGSVGRALASTLLPLHG